MSDWEFRFWDKFTLFIKAVWVLFTASLLLVVIMFVNALYFLFNWITQVLKGESLVSIEKR